jgi:hypothetical protein
VAAPSFIAASTGLTDATGAFVATGHAPGAAGRIIVFQVLQDGATAGAVTFTSATNIENLAGTDNAWTQIPGPLTNGAWAVGGTPEAHQYIFIGRSLSTSAPTFTGGNSTSEDTYWRFYEFTDVSTGTTLATVIENIGGTSDLYANGAGTGVTISDTGVTTSGPDRLALQLVAANDDIAIDAFASETGGDWVEAVAEYAESSGTDGAVQLQTAYPAVLDLDYTSTSGLSPAGIGTAAGVVEQRGQSFVASSSALLTSIAVYLDREASPADNIIFEIQTDNAGVPSGTVVGTSVAVAASTISLTGALYSFEVRASLTASTTYWIVGRRSGAFSGTDLIRWSFASVAYGSGSGATFNGSSWATGQSDRAFATYYNTAGTINGGSDTVVSAAWGVVGFALIGTTVESGGNTYTKAGYGKESG